MDCDNCESEMMEDDDGDWITYFCPRCQSEEIEPSD